MKIYKKLNKIEAVIFDMDGLIFDTERLGLRIFTEAACEEGISTEAAANAFIKTIGIDDDASRTVVVNELGADFPYDNVKQRYRERKRQYYEKHGVPVKTGVYELLALLEEKNIPRATATSTPKKSAEYMLDKMNILARLNGGIYGDMVENGKPDPEIYLKTAELLGIKAENCLVLEDSFYGIQAAYGAGMMPVMVPDILQPDAEIEKMLYIKCGSLLDVVEFLKKEK